MRCSLPGGAERRPPSPASTTLRAFLCPARLAALRASPAPLASVPWRVLAVVAALVVAACSYWAVTQRKRAEHAMLHRTPEGYRHMTVV